jgi:hypothetical protein
MILPTSQLEMSLLSILVLFSVRTPGRLASDLWRTVSRDLMENDLCGPIQKRLSLRIDERVVGVAGHRNEEVSIWQLIRETAADLSTELVANQAVSPVGMLSDSVQLRRTLAGVL